MKTAVVTGAAGALGVQVANRLSAEGLKVIGVDRAERPASLMRDVHFIGCVDLVCTRSRDLATSVAKASPSVDALVNIAGGFVWETIEAGQNDTWIKMFEINVLTALNTCRAVLPMISQGGVIVNIGAAAAQRAQKGMGSYAASKAALIKLSEALDDEVRDRGIRVNVISPTIIDTPANRMEMPQADFSDWVKPESIADLASFLVSAQSASIHGQNVIVSAND